MRYGKKLLNPWFIAFKDIIGLHFLVLNLLLLILAMLIAIIKSIIESIIEELEGGGGEA